MLLAGSQQAMPPPIGVRCVRASGTADAGSIFMACGQNSRPLACLIHHLFIGTKHPLHGTRKRFYS